MLQDKVVFDNKINSASISSCNKAYANFDWHTSFQLVINIYLTYKTEILIVQP